MAPIERHRENVARKENEAADLLVVFDRDIAERRQAKHPGQQLRVGARMPHICVGREQCDRRPLQNDCINFGELGIAQIEIGCGRSDAR